MTSTQMAIFVDFPTEIRRSQNSDVLFRRNASCLLACRLVDIFEEHYSFSDFLLEAVPCFARETSQEGPSKLLGTGDERRHP